MPNQSYLDRYKICVVCNVSKAESGPGRVLYARFPRDPERRKLWLHAVSIDGLSELTEEKLLKKYVCGKHFTDEDFTRNQRVLMKDAIPCLNLTSQINRNINELPMKSEPSCSDVLPELVTHDDTQNWNTSSCAGDSDSDLEPLIHRKAITDDKCDSDVYSLCLAILKCNVCRLCLCSSRELVDKGQHSDFVENIPIITGISFSENFFYPLKVCNECIVKIDEIIKFRETCLQSDSKLRLISKTHSIEQVVGTVQDDVKLQKYAKELAKIYHKSPVKEETEIKNEIIDYDNQSDGGVNDSFIDVPVLNEVPKVKRKSERRKLKTNKKINKKIKGDINWRIQRSLRFALTPKKLDDNAEVYEIIPTDTDELLTLKKTDIKAYIKIKSKRICPVCNKLFSGSSNLRHHYYRMHIGQATSICEQCGRAFVDKNALKRHSLVHVDIKQYLCKVCGHSMRTDMGYRIHMRVKHSGTGVVSKPYKCQLCDKRFSTNSIRRQHENLHRNPTPYQCDLCGKKFASKRTCVDHSAAIHLGERNYHCEMCSATFGFKEPLRRHRINVHGVNHTPKAIEMLKEMDRNRTMLLANEANNAP